MEIGVVTGTEALADCVRLAVTMFGMIRWENVEVDMDGGVNASILRTDLASRGCRSG